MADRMSDMRQLLFDKLRELGTPGTWHHLIEQRGMFGYTGLDGKILLIDDQLLVDKDAYCRSVYMYDRVILPSPQIFIFLA